MSDPHATVVQLLGSMSSPREVRQYLEHYAGAEGAQKLAVIKIGGRVLADELDEVADALAFLHRVRLHPVIVHGAGPQLDEALAAAGIESRFDDGLRVTPPEVLAIARRVFHEVNHALVDALAARGVRARPLTSGVIDAELHDADRLGMVGEATGVRAEAIAACVRAGDVPVIAPLGESATGQILNVNGDTVTRVVSEALQAHKVIFLTATGGLCDDAGRVIEAINLVEDEARLLAAPWLSGGMERKLREISGLLDALPPTASVSITDPQHLARELFTHRGAGTLVRRGERILRFDKFRNVDTSRTRDLLEICFERKLSPTYFDDAKPIAVYLADSYRAVAIVTALGEVPYLDKLAVTAEAQGVGLGGSLWARLVADHPRLVWRARQGNPINAWYFNQATGAVRSGEWVVFWSGDFSLASAAAVVERAAALPATLTAHAEGA